MYFPCPSCKNKVSIPNHGEIPQVVCPGCDKTFAIADAVQQGILDKGAVIGGYEIIQLIGIGGMGKVYEALQISLQRKVALKVIAASVTGSEMMAKRFLLEVRSTASLEHPSIVTVFEASEQDGLLYLAMELVHGQTLEEMAKECGGRLDEDAVWNYAEKVIDAMNYAWRYQRLLHRDIKPANIMVLDSGQVKICDLGIAKRPDDKFDLTKAGMAIGTPHYMSPEQGRGKTDLDFRADIYSLGASMFHLITGRQLFPGENAVSVITQHILDDAPDPKEVHPKMSDAGAELLSMMLVKKPEDRHGSWDDLLQDVRRVKAGKMPIHCEAGAELTTHEGVEKGGVSDGGFNRTMVDMDAIQQELRLAELNVTHSKSGWSLVRMACLVTVLMVMVGLIGYQFRRELLPEAFVVQRDDAPPALRLDDGTPPAPPAIDRATDTPLQMEGDTYFEDLVTTIPRKVPIHTLARILNRVAKEGYSPVSLARAAAREGRRDLAIRIYNLLVGSDGSWTGHHRATALTDLATLFTASSEQAKLPTLYRRAISVAMELPSPHGAIPYLGMAELHWRALKPLMAYKLLHQGIGRFLKADRPDDANLLAVALLRSLENSKDQGRLYEYSQIVKSALPKDTPAHKLATTFLDTLTPIPEAHLRTPQKSTSTKYCGMTMDVPESDAVSKRDD